MKMKRTNKNTDHDITDSGTLSAHYYKTCIIRYILYKNQYNLFHCTATKNALEISSSFGETFPPEFSL
jgi:hypothetical protein